MMLGREMFENANRHIAISAVIAGLATLAFATGAGATTGTVTSVAAFATDTSGPVAGDFSDVPLPNCSGSACFGGGNPLSGYASLQGVSFSTPNMDGSVNVNSAFFYSPSDLAEPYAVNSVYDGTAADIITITLPSAATAFALDFNTLFTTTTANFALSNGFSIDVSHTATVGTTQFLGFLSTTPFDTITFTVPYGQSIVIADFQAATTSDLVRLILDQALLAAEEDDCYQALKLVRRIIQHEDAVLGKTPIVSIPTGNSDRHAEREPRHTGV